MNWRKNIDAENKWAGVGNNPLIADADEYDLQFIDTANALLNNAVEILRQLISSHQSANAIIIHQDWKTVRKFFSLSEKYKDWKHYAEPATCYGIHNYLLHFNKPIRLIQFELEVYN